ncbi:MAG: heme exporter protein CcmD [Paracoccaceae bacterium]
MMPDLGQYAFEVSLAYIGSLILLFGLIWLSWRQAQVTHRKLDEAERRNDV